MSGKFNWIQTNIRDRGIAFENFLDERRKIILELRKINSKMKQKPSAKNKLILRAVENNLLSKLSQLEVETEARLKEIRERAKF